MIMPRENQNHLPRKHNIFKRSYKTFNKENFILDYFNINWNEVIDTDKNDANLSMENFLSTFNKLLDKHIPLKKITQKQFKQKFKPWISKEILNRIKEKNKILQKYIKCNVQNRKTQLYNNFKNIKNEITNMTRNSKKIYYQKYFSDNKNNLQKVWKGIKEIINIKTKNFDKPTSLQVGDEYITNPKKVSNSFNNYFASVADEILKKRRYNGSKSYRDYLSNSLLENFIFDDCTENEITSIISTLDLNKSYGPNSIPSNILHLLKDEICHPLRLIFNISFLTGQHPDILKL